MMASQKNNLSFCSRFLIGCFGNLVMLCAFVFCLWGASMAMASQPGLSEAEEVRAVQLGNEIRCVTCQAQSINDSNAEMAMTLRQLVRERIAQGASDDEIRGFLSDRYGDTILLRPPVQINTFVLWFGPFLILLLGGLGVWRFIKAQGKGRTHTQRQKSDRG